MIGQDDGREGAVVIKVCLLERVRSLGKDRLAGGVLIVGWRKWRRKAIGLEGGSSTNRLHNRRNCYGLPAVAAADRPRGEAGGVCFDCGVVFVTRDVASEQLPAAGDRERAAWKSCWQSELWRRWRGRRL
jgi:hypothetical protein